MGTEQASDQIQVWRAETGPGVQSAQRVQDRLLDLYGHVKIYPVKHQVERFLSLTLERSMFDAAEITELLDEIETTLAVEALGIEEPGTLQPSGC